MTTKEALVRLNQPFSYPPDTDSYFDAKEVAMKSLEKDLSIIKELEKIKQKIGRIETVEGGDFLERPATDIIYEAQKIIDNHIAELKGGAE